MIVYSRKIGMYMEGRWGLGELGLPSCRWWVSMSGDDGCFQIQHSSSSSNSSHAFFVFFLASCDSFLASSNSFHAFSAALSGIWEVEVAEDGGV